MCLSSCVVIFVDFVRSSLCQKQRLDYNESLQMTVKFPCVPCRRDGKSCIVREVDDTNTVLQSN